MIVRRDILKGVSFAATITAAASVSACEPVLFEPTDIDKKFAKIFANQNLRNLEELLTDDVVLFDFSIGKELVIGTENVILFLKDWRKSRFERHLSSINPFDGIMFQLPSTIIDSQNVSVCTFGLIESGKEKITSDCGGQGFYDFYLDIYDRKNINRICILPARNEYREGGWIS